MSGTESSAAGYAEAADALAVQYESITFEQSHGHWLHLFPSPPARVLDVGAGTGRDASALAARGYRVTAAEPTAELRKHGQRLHASASIEWTSDGLPALATLTGSARQFDLILLNAVLMHLDHEERAASLQTLVLLLAPAGRILISLRHGPIPAGRRMFDVSANDVLAAARTVALDGEFLGARGDVLGRADVTWSDLFLTHDRNCFQQSKEP